VDETDRYEDNQSKKRAKRMTTAAVMRGSVLHAHKWRNTDMPPTESSSVSDGMDPPRASARLC
jgi:hypothetical protein